MPKQPAGDDPSEPKRRSSGLRRLRSDPGNKTDHRGIAAALSAARLKRQVEPITNLGLRRWPEKSTRRLRNVLIVFTLLGPVFGLGVAALSIPAGPTDQVLASDPGSDEDPRPKPNEVAARVTLLNPDLGSGELTARIVLQPGSDLIADTATQALTRSIQVTVLNDITGRTQTVFETDSRVEPITATLQLSGSRLTRYPVDNYKADLVLFVQREVDPGKGEVLTAGPKFESVPIVVTVRSSLSDLRVSGDTEPSDENVLKAELDLERPRTVVFFAIALMGLVWLLAIGCVALAWGVLVQARAIPFWCWGFFAGVLFALPQLRNGLPGSPPFGSLIDWAAYYWALGMVGVSLLALILAGNVAIRAGSPAGPAETGSVNAPKK